MVKPVTLAFEHSGCRHCLVKLIDIETVPKCPLCKAPIGIGTLHVNIALNDIIGKFDVKVVKVVVVYDRDVSRAQATLKSIWKVHNAVCK